MTLKPKPHRILLNHAVPGALGAVAVWLVQSWRGDEPTTSVVVFLIGWFTGQLLFLGHLTDRGTLSLWGNTLVGPGGLFAGRVPVVVSEPLEGEILHASWWNRLNGVCWLKTPGGSIRLNRRWYAPADLQRFVDVVRTMEAP
jgi:hypothetical protein